MLVLLFLLLPAVAPKRSPKPPRLKTSRLKKPLRLLKKPLLLRQLRLLKKPLPLKQLRLLRKPLPLKQLRLLRKPPLNSLYSVV